MRKITFLKISNNYIYECCYNAFHLLLMSKSRKIMYIGRTTQNTRFSKHRSHYKRYLQNKNFCRWYSAFEVLKCDDVEFHIIKECEDKKDSIQSERDIIKCFKNACIFHVVNKIS